MDASSTIAIVGKPNVGKSTLFNRLIGKRHSIVALEAGTTRDRIYQNFECNGYKSLLVDTGGLEYGKKENIEADIQAQSKVAIAEADVILFILDLSETLTKDDFSAADILRKSKKNVILVANKSDHKNIEENVYNLFELGFGDAVQVSAIHNLGIEELETKIANLLKKLKFKKSRKTTQKKNENPCLCILGKPNAGKSSLFNALLGAPKVIVSDIPGTTRDSIDTEIVYQEKKYTLIDTAGLRRPGKIERGIEKFSSFRAIQAIERCDIALLVIDATEKISHQDCHIAHYTLEANKGLMILINKIDLIEEEDGKARILGVLKRKFAFIPWAPIVFISAKDKTNIYQILNLTDQIMKEREKRIPTPQLNSFFQKITHKHLPASAKIKKPKFLYASQVETAPPTFALFFNNSNNLHFSYPRYLENEIRKEYGFDGTSILLKFKHKASER